MIYPTIKQLRYFIALCDQQHFGRAAAQSFVSQSAFSTAIQDLESALDTQLVDRTKRQVTITAIGQEIATQARLCLSQALMRLSVSQLSSAFVCLHFVRSTSDHTARKSASSVLSCFSTCRLCS